MNILVTSPTFHPVLNGLSNSSLWQATVLSQAGHKITVATEGTKRETQHYRGFRIERFSARTKLPWVPQWGHSSPEYVKFLIEGDWDFCIFNAWQNWATDLALVHLDKIKGAKYVFSHCISTNSFFIPKFVRSLIRYLLWRPYWFVLRTWMKKLDAVIFLSSGGVDSRFDDHRLAKKLGIQKYYVSNAITSDGELESLNKSRRSIGGEYLISVGSYTWQKGFDFVLRAYAQSSLCNRMPLRFFGLDKTEFADKLISLASKLGIRPENIELHYGVQGKKLQEQYKRASLVLFGSYSECQPLALLDAIAAGTPFIARDTGCIRQMSGGVTVTSTKQMALAIDRLCEDGDLWYSLSEAANSAARTLYHPEVVQKQLLSALKL